MSPRLRKYLLYGGALVFLVAAYALTLVAFDVQRTNGSKQVRVGAARDGIVVLGRILDVDPASDAMTVRLEFFPVGRFARDRILLAQPVDVYINTSKGRSVLHFAAGTVMSPTEATLAFTKGELLDYPFDHYSTALIMFAGDARHRPVPLAQVVSTGFSGFRITTSQGRYRGQPYPTFDLRRATSTIFFAVFIMVLFWAVALGAFGVAVRLAERQRKFEAGFTGFLAALLFAFPTVRNNLPGSPPIGALNDFLAFFWTEGIVAISLVVVLVTYFVRRLPGTAPPDA